MAAESLKDLVVDRFPNASWLEGSSLDLMYEASGDDYVLALTDVSSGKLFSVGDLTFRFPKGKTLKDSLTPTRRYGVIVRVKGNRAAPDAPSLPTGIVEIELSQLEIEVSAAHVVAASLQEWPHRKLVRRTDKDGNDLPVVFRAPGVRLTLDVRKKLLEVIAGPNGAGTVESAFAKFEPLLGAPGGATTVPYVPVLTADPPHFMRKDGSIGATCGDVRLYLGSEGPAGAGDSFRGLTFAEFGVYLNNDGAPDTWSGLIRMEKFRLAFNPAKISGRFWTEVLHHTAFNPQLEVSLRWRDSPDAEEHATQPAKFASSAVLTIPSPPPAGREYLEVRPQVWPNWRNLPAEDEDEALSHQSKRGGYRVVWTIPEDALLEAPWRQDEADLGWVRLPPGGHSFIVHMHDARYENRPEHGRIEHRFTVTVPGVHAGMRVILEAAVTDASGAAAPAPKARSRIHVAAEAGQTLVVKAHLFGSSQSARIVTLSSEAGTGAGAGAALAIPGDALVSLPPASGDQFSATARWTIAVPASLNGMAREGALVVSVAPIAGSTTEETVRRLRYSLREASASDAPVLLLTPEEDWAEAESLARVAVTLRNGVREEDITWELERIEKPLSVLSTAADDNLFRAAANPFPAADTENPSLIFSAGGVAPWLHTADAIWRLTARVAGGGAPRPRSPIVIGEDPTSLRAGEGGAGIARSESPLAFRPHLGNAAASDTFILFPRDVSRLGAGGNGEIWEPVAEISHARSAQEILAVQARGLIDLLDALMRYASVIESVDFYGCASSEGTDLHNRELSDNRAQAVAEFIDDAITRGPLAAYREVFGAGAPPPASLPAEQAFKTDCAALLGKMLTTGLGTWGAKKTSGIDTNDRRCFVVLRLGESALGSLTARCYFSTHSGAPGRPDSLIPLPLSAAAHPLRHHWVRQIRLEAELKDNRLLAALMHVTLDTRELAKHDDTPGSNGFTPDDFNNFLLGVTLAYAEIPGANASPSTFELAGEVYSPPEDKDGLARLKPDEGQTYLQGVKAALAGSAAIAPAVVALGSNNVSVFAGLGGAAAGAVLTRTSTIPGKSVIAPKEMIFRGVRLKTGWSGAQNWRFDVGVSYEVSYDVNIDLSAIMPQLTAKLVTDKAMRLRVRNLAVRISNAGMPQMLYDPKLGLGVDLADPGLLKIEGLNGAESVLTKFLSLEDIKFSLTNPMSIEGNIEFKFPSGFFKIGGLQVKASFDPSAMLAEGLNKALSFEFKPQADKITLGAKIPKVLEGGGTIRLGQPIGGDLDLSLLPETLKLKIYGSLGLWLKPEMTAMIASAGFEISPGFPLGGSGLGLQGLDALVGVNVERSEQDPLKLLDWYKTPPVGVGGVDKWVPRRAAFAFGAGAKLGTLADKGFSWWLKGMLVVQLPGPQIMLAARSGFFLPVKNQPKADDKSQSGTEGGLFTAIILDFERRVFFAAIDFEMEQKKVFKFFAPVRIYFNLADGTDFYIRFGQYAPPGGRLIEITLFEYFSSWGYLQIESKGFTAPRTNFPPLRLEGFCAALGGRTQLKIGAKPILWFEAAIEFHIGVQSRPFYLEGSVFAYGEAGLLGASVGADARLQVRAGNDAASNSEILYVYAEVGFEVRFLLWKERAVAKLELGNKDAALPPASPLVAFAALPRFQDKTIDAAGVPLDARLRLEFDKVVTAGAINALHVGAVDENNRVSDEISYRFAIESLALDGPDPSDHVDGVNLWASFPLATEPGQPTQSLQLFSPGLADPLFVDQIALTAAQRDQLREQISVVCELPTPLPIRSSVVDGMAPGPADRWALSANDLRPVAIDTFTTELLGAGWTQLQGGSLANVAAVVALPTVSFADAHATSRALRLPRGRSGDPAIDIGKLGPAISTQLKRQGSWLYRSGDLAWTSGKAPADAAVTTALTTALWELGGSRSISADGASRLSRAVVLSFPPLVAARAVLLTKKNSKGGGALWLDAEGLPISDPALGFQGALDLAPVIPGNAGSGSFADFEARQLLLTSDVARPATKLLLVGMLDSDAYFVELAGSTVADAADQAARQARNASTRSEMTRRQEGLYADPAHATNRPLLKPDRQYTLSGTIRWRRRRGQEEEADGLFSLADSGLDLSFRTAASAPRDIAPYVHRLDPGDASLPLYVGEDLRLVLKTDTLDEIYRRYGRRLVASARALRTGRMLNRYTAEISTRTFVPLGETAETIAAAVESAVCLAGVTPNPPHEEWVLTGLDPDSAYEFIVVDLPGGSNAPPPTNSEVRAAQLDPGRGPLWSGRFRTSRFASFEEHVAAFAAADPDGLTPRFDLVVESTAQLTALFPPAGSPPIRDDLVLEKACRLLFGGALAVPTRCESVRLWTQDVAGSYTLLGILLDSPEPLLRRNIDFDQVTLANAGRVLTGASGARLICLAPPVTAASIGLGFTYRRAAADAALTVALSLPVPASPY